MTSLGNYYYVGTGVSQTATSCQWATNNVANIANQWVTWYEPQTAPWNCLYQTYTTAGTSTIYVNDLWQWYEPQTGWGAVTVGTPYAPTPEEIAQQEAAEAERQKAKDRAKNLLISVLSDEQLKQFATDESFELEVNGNLYRIRPGRKVEKLNKNTKKPECLFCIHPDFQHGLPAEDVAISQKLLLESDEKTFLRIANRWAA